MIKSTIKFNLIGRLTTNYCRSNLISSKLTNLSKSNVLSTNLTKTSNFHSYSKWLAEDKEKFYALSMFPYPSGNLHMGHVRVYTISDTLARYQRMANPTSTKVIHPMGWDAFGLPAENAAIERGINPKDWTLSNIDVMKNQLGLMDTKFDWDKEVITCSKDYYKFTQKLILLLHEHGLLYQKEALVNWDPVDKTVLANEQVDSEGRSWRSGAIVEQKYLKQWFVKITDYAEDLLKDLELLTGWPEKVRTMQSNWIGKSEGCEINFNLSLPNTDINKLTVFTTRADTLYGVQYIAVSLNHPIIKSALVTDKARNEVNRVKSESKNSEELSMEGVNLGVDVIHPLTKESIPVYAAPYVLEDYGTGSVMGVPAHDQRDWNFFHLNEISENLKFVIGPSADPDHLDKTQPFLEDGIMLSYGKNGSFGAKTSIQARKSISDLITQEGAGKAVNQYRLRDWLISRQRYWGAPIPFIHCDSCGVVPVPDEQLPVELPDLDVLSNEGGSPLAKSSEFVNCQCPKCKGPAKRDTDTMDTFVDSSWYFLRHLDAKNPKEMFDQNIVSKQMPVDLYIGGIEHAILHLLYSRFITKFLWKNGYLKSNENQELTDLDKMRGEPFKKLLTQGMVQGKTYKSSTNGRFVKLDDVKVIDQYQAVHKETNDPLIVTYEKMSKSKYNGVDPEKTIKLNGVDSTRLYMLYKAPPSDNLDWDDHSIIGIKRWLNKIDKLIETPSKEVKPINLQELNQEAKNLYRVINFTIKEVTQSFETNYQFNTAIAFLIKLTHSLTDYSQLKGFNPSDSVYSYGLKVLIQMLSPMAPRKAQSLWDQYFIAKSGDKVEECRWPQVDLEGLKEDKVNVVIQINGKKRQVADLSVDLLDELLPQSLTLDKLASSNYEEFLEKVVNPEIKEKFIGQKKVFKVIIGNNRKLVNYLVK